MADLSGWRWEKFVPDLGENRSLEKPFYLWVKGSLSEVQLAEYEARVQAMDATPEAAARALDGVVRLGEEPLTLDGQSITTLQEYVRAVWGHSRFDAFLELVRAVTWHNSLEGRRALFSERLSGGRASTPAPAPQAANALARGSSTKP